MSSDSILSSSPNSPANVSTFACFEISFGSYIFTAFLGSYFIFFLPLCIWVVHLGLQRFASTRTLSNQDIFTYNILAMELIGIMGSCFFCIGSYTSTSQIRMVGIYIFTIIIPGQMLFHSLTSVERYLAVIYPVTYRALRSAHMIRIRNLSIGSIWAAAFAWVVLIAVYGFYLLSVPMIALLVFSVFVNSFCSLSILCTLIRPGPGEGGVNRDRVDQAKRGALQTIVAITSALLLNLGGSLLCIVVEATGALGSNARCVALVLGLSSTVPSSYIMPLLFLHRAGKLPRFKRSSAESSSVSG